MFPVELAFSDVALGEETVSVAFVRDVSKRKQAQRYLAAHYTSTCILAGAQALDEVLPRILQAVCDGLNWEAGTLWRVDSATNTIRCTESYEAPAARLPS